MALATKPDHLKLFTGPMCWKERNNPQELPPGLHTHATACVIPETINVKKKLRRKTDDESLKYALLENRVRENIKCVKVYL